MRHMNNAGPPLAAILGGIVWVVLAGLSALGRLPLATIEVIFLLAPLVIIPLGLRAQASPRAHDPDNSPCNWARQIQPLGAVLAVASFFFPPGLRACLLASGWLIICCVIGLCGLLRLWQDGLKSAEQACCSIGLIYLPVGGVGLVASRLGIGFIGFKEPIVLLTAVHFHYAGFAAPLLVGAEAQVLHPISVAKHKVLRFAAWGVIVAPALVAMGFVLSPLLKIVSSFLLAASLMALSVLTLESLPLIKPRIARGLLALSALSVPTAMMLVGVYAVGDYTGHELISIPRMAVYHGITNSLGFALCGLLAWTMVASREST